MTASKPAAAEELYGVRLEKPRQVVEDDFRFHLTHGQVGRVRMLLMAKSTTRKDKDPAVVMLQVGLSFYDEGGKLIPSETFEDEPVFTRADDGKDTLDWLRQLHRGAWLAVRASRGESIAAGMKTPPGVEAKAFGFYAAERAKDEDADPYWAQVAGQLQEQAEDFEEDWKDE